MNIKSNNNLDSFDLTGLRESLLYQKSVILNKTLRFKEEGLSTVVAADESDVAAIESNNSISIHLHERDRQALLHIEKALGKIDMGSYGFCDSCGQQISQGRLTARPFTDLCIECMEEREGSPTTLQ